MFVAFEGIDGVGKSTQARLLYKRLKREGREAILTHEPSGSPIGKLAKTVIRRGSTLDNTTLQLLFAADRTYHVLHTIRPTLDMGKDVITDRYLFSTIAYGAASGIDRKWLIEMNSMFVMPDFTFVLDAEPKTAMRRIAARAPESKGAEVARDIEKSRMAHRDLFEKEGFLGKARKEYIGLKKQYRNYYIVDGGGKPEEVEARIGKILKI